MHIENDAGKLVHAGGKTLCDYNRAGSPLMEIVTEPDFRSKADVIAYLEELQKLMRWCGASDADMEKGQLRCDVNISIRLYGEEKLRNRVELKNINSFASIARAIDVEYARQGEIYESGATLDQETRGWNDERGYSTSLRSKEDAMDYRYFPDPDLPPLILTKEYIQERDIGELPIDRRLGAISKRAHENDILGEFSSEYDPLHLLKYKIGKLNAAPPDWWQPRGEAHMDAARYPATDSTLEWANEIMAFDQLLVEGFQVKPLRKQLEARGRKAEASWASLRVIAEIFVASGQTVDDAKALLAPLSRLHALRSILKAHSSVEEKNKEERQARATHGTLRAHFKDLAGQCDKSFDTILRALGAGDLNP